MSADTVTLMGLLHESLMTAATVALPIIGVGLSVGFFIGLLQAATQVNETALTFVPKLVATGVFLGLTGNYAVAQLGRLLTHAIETLGSGTL